MSQRFTICEQYAINAKLFKMYEPFDVGDFTVKPHLMCHSAFDAAAFEIKCNGKTVIYSGDFRGHGRKPGCLDRFIKHVTKQADVLFTEGSLVSRQNERTITEDELEKAIVDKLQGKTGIALFQSSGQNIDRLVSFYKAALQLRRTFVIDIYTANVLHELRSLGTKIPYPSYDKMKVFYPYVQTRKVHNEIGAEYAQRFTAYYIPKKQVADRQNEIVMLVRPSMKIDLKRCNLTGGTLIYSQWEGYRNGDSQQKFEKWLGEQGFDTTILHTSGHATVSDIRRLIDGLNPKKIVPIHTLKPTAFLEYSEKVEIQKDGEAFEI
jgi:ribonuclease J